MELQINRWGNSLALRLPTKILKQMHLHEGSKVRLELADDGRLMVQSTQVAQDMRDGGY
jgi:antitoxin MazE